MKFRDLFLTVMALISAMYACTTGQTSLRAFLFRSQEINREDATRESTTLLSTEEWTEFQVVPRADSFRLLTNAALESMDAPDYDLSNPRLGWRYAIQYELLDSSRNLIEKSEYHFRSSIRQLIDADSSEVIYPLFFGKSSLVATQTRTMQIAVNRQDGKQVSILRAKLLVADEQIKEVVARALARIERPDFEDRKTWNRMSPKRREMISRYCIYNHELLTVNERNSLLRFRWTRCPTLGQFSKRFLFFIGEENDLEVRDEQLPMGFYTDPRTKVTIPVPEGMGLLRVNFTTIDPVSEQIPVSIIWHGIGSENKIKTDHVVNVSPTQTALHEIGKQGGQEQAAGDLQTPFDPDSDFEMQVEGGILELSTSDRLIVRAFWQPLDELAKQTVVRLQEQSSTLLDENAIEITPRAMGIRTFVVDSESLEFTVSHIDDDPTPFRLQLRYPLGVLFDNQTLGDPTSFTASNDDSIPGSIDAAGSNSQVTYLNWEMVDRDDQIVESGVIEWSPSISPYDWLTSNGMRELISDPTDFYFELPSNVNRLRIRCRDDRILANGYVRPKGKERTIRVPEDSHPFNRLMGTHRTWFGIYPEHQSELIRANRSFVVASQIRPPEINEEILVGNYEWTRFLPEKTWIGRQILIPKTTETEMGIRQEAINSTFFEIASGAAQAIEPLGEFSSKDSVEHKILYFGNQPPGQTAVLVNGETVKHIDLRSHRGQISLDTLPLAETGRIEIRSENPARFFVNGVMVPNSHCYLKRTALRLDQGKLEFNYTKSTFEDEILTIRLYRQVQTDQRMQVGVHVEAIDQTRNQKQPQSSWTIRNRRYDLRPLPELPSLSLGSSHKADVGHRCFLKLGSELAPGDYRITVEYLGPESDPLVLLYQTKAGRTPKRKIKIQRHKETQP